MVANSFPRSTAAMVAEISRNCSPESLLRGGGGGSFHGMAAASRRAGARVRVCGRGGTDAEVFIGGGGDTDARRGRHGAVVVRGTDFRRGRFSVREKK